jgi:hypothetical protein
MSSERKMTKSRKPGKKQSGPALYRALQAQAPRSYAGQVLFPPQWIWGPPLTMTCAASICANTISTDPVGFITGWANRFQATFDEYRVVGLRVHVQPAFTLAGTNINCVCWFDEASAAAPTLNESKEKDSKMFLANPYVAKTLIMRWKPHDLNDLNYQPTATSFNPVTFKFYTDVNWGVLSCAAAQVASVRIEYLIEFRGLKST